MSRNLDSTLAASYAAGTVMPINLAMITFGSGPKFCWSGPGPLVWTPPSLGYSCTFLGIGSLGQVSGYSEGVDVRASGVTVQLSGIDPVLLSECLNDIQVGATARLWKGNWQQGAGGVGGSLLGVPYQWFRGQVDKPAFQIGAEALTIALSLESRIVDLQRASNRRYTNADQRLSYPTDSGFSWVEMQIQAAWIWG